MSFNSDSSNNSLAEWCTVPLGDGALRISLPETIDTRAVLDSLRAHPRVVDVVVTERHACIYFDPLDPPDNPVAVLKNIAHASAQTIPRPLIIIRARYDGPDLIRLAEHVRMTPEQIIDLHAGRDYIVRVVGFMPGFAYLGEVDARIAAPRLATPRTRVPAGAIGVAGLRTGVYPFAAPGGWNLLATAVDFTAFNTQSGAALQLGDRVRFEPL